jgi:hypothetical protein
LKEYSDRNVKEKLWGEVCANVISSWTGWSGKEEQSKGTYIYVYVLCLVNTLLETIITEIETRPAYSIGCLHFFILPRYWTLWGNKIIGEISRCTQCFGLRLFLDFIRSNKAITQVLSIRSFPLLKYTSHILVAVCRPQYFSAIATFQSRRQ